MSDLELRKGNIKVRNQGALSLYLAGNKMRKGLGSSLSNQYNYSN